MSDAPETLWVWVLSKSQSSFLAYKDKPGELGKPTEYTRTDISQARIAQLKGALLDATASLAAAASAYRTYASRHISRGNPTKDALYGTRVHDFDKSVSRARAALKDKP
jgi:hypothetical protein